MTNVICIRLRQSGRIYYFNPGAFALQKGDFVIVETARGPEYGEVVSEPRLASDKDINPPLKPVLRLATEKDAQTNEHNRELEKEAAVIFQQKVAAHELKMKLVDAVYNFDGSRITFFFAAEGRVDFRELVKDLASTFRTRIELRQIGVRDQAKVGCGIGICGRPFCCATFLPEFVPVSIKMAKDQNISLNPAKLSGTCGRLMCCLKYEQATYEELNKKLPDEGDVVETADGAGEVLHVNVLRQMIKVGIKQEKGDVIINDYKLEDIKVLQHKSRKKNREKMNREEELELEKLEETSGSEE